MPPGPDAPQRRPLHYPSSRGGQAPGRAHQYKVGRMLAALRSADRRVITVKVADRLHNMQTLQFLPHAKQLRKAREVLDIFLPVTGELSLHAIQSELQALAC